MTITFLKSRHQTAGALDAFKVTIPTALRTVVPHFHRHYDETVFGPDGTTTWTVDGVVTEVGPGEQLFVARGAITLREPPPEDSSDHLPGDPRPARPGVFR